MKRLVFLLIWFPIFCFSQEQASTGRNSFIRVHSGIIVDNYNSAGPRLYFEYLKQIKSSGTLYWGVSYETKWHALNPATDNYVPPDLNTNNLSFNIHYTVTLWKDKLFWDFFGGSGGIYLWGEGKYSMQPSFNFGATLNIKLSRNVYFETSSLAFLLPISNVTISTNKLYRNNSTYSQFSILPFGLKFKIN